MSLAKLENLNEPQLRSMMRAMAQSVEIVAENFGCEKPLFTLLLFNDPKVGQYICNCQRAEMIQCLRETADRLERREDIPR